MEAPHPIWQGTEMVHGMTLSDDGNRAYMADPTGGDLLILDTSQIQQRKANAQAVEISRLTWPRVSIPRRTRQPHRPASARRAMQGSSR